MTLATPANPPIISPEIGQFLEHLNAAWLARDYEELARFYHPDIVLLPPDAGAPLLGRDAVIATYRDFHAACSVEQFRVTEASSWAFAAAEPRSSSTSGGLATSIVHMRFAIDYRLKTTQTDTGSSERPVQSEQGMDVYTLQHNSHNERPEIIWRAQFTL